jgi:hypothetical protein
MPSEPTTLLGACPPRHAPPFHIKPLTTAHEPLQRATVEFQDGEYHPAHRAPGWQPKVPVAAQAVA